MKELTGRVYDIQGFSVQDGPGIRTTVFLKGCPLRCPWCHSPESQQFHAQLSWMATRCVGLEECGKCLDACSKGAISAGRKAGHLVTRKPITQIHVDRTKCNDCAECTSSCSRKALSICGKDYTIKELVKRVCKDVPFYDNSGGGVTISGGEPFSQHEFLQEFLLALKECKIHTAIDTTGYARYEIIERSLPYTDLYLYDIKHMDSCEHKGVTGVPNEVILENARRIAAAGGKMQIRVPVIPSFNDSDENIRRTGLFCRSLGDAVTLMQLLPYHNLGVMKYQRIDDSRTVLEADPPSEEKIASLKKILEDLGLAVTVH